MHLVKILISSYSINGLNTVSPKVRLGYINPESLANNKLLKWCPRKLLSRKKNLVVIGALYKYPHYNSSGQMVGWALPIPLNDA